MAWRKGESGNPSGRPPKDQALTDILKRTGHEVPEGESRTRNELLALTLWGIALEGDERAIRHVYDRIDGKPVESVDLAANLAYRVIPADEEAINADN